MDGLQNNLQNHYRVFLSMFYCNTQLSECHNKLLEESFRKIFKTSKYSHRTKWNFLFDFLNKKYTNHHTLILRTSPLNSIFSLTVCFVSIQHVSSVYLMITYHLQNFLSFLNYIFTRAAWKMPAALVLYVTPMKLEVYLWSVYSKVKL